jgi:hypothetical protein
MRKYDVIPPLVSSISLTHKVNPNHVYVRRFSVLEKRPVVFSGG